LYLEAQINGRDISWLVNTGAMHSFMSPKLVKELGLWMQKLSKPINMRFAFNGMEMILDLSRNPIATRGKLNVVSLERLGDGRFVVVMQAGQEEGENTKAKEGARGVERCVDYKTTTIITTKERSGPQD
jgi:hypothetical protein